jgi:hypothetical protein
VNALDENRDCSRTFASFILTGDGLIKSDATRALSIQPDFAANKGEVRADKGRTLAQPTGVWLINSKQLEATSSERHLSFLLDRLAPAANDLRELLDRQGLSADFSCYWASATGHGGPVISADVLRRIADIGASLGYDFDASH